MDNLITQIFTVFSETISGLTGGLKDAFMHLLYVDPAASELVVSDLSLFIFMMLGLSMALGLVYTIFGLIKRRG